MEKAVAPIADGLQAVSYRTSDVKDGNRESEAIPDHTTRLKASGMALKLLGAEKAASDIPQGNQFIQVNNNYGDRYKD